MKQPNQTKLELPLERTNRHKQLKMGQEVLIKSKIIPGYEDDELGNIKRNLYVEHFDSPKIGYYVGWTVRQAGTIVPGNFDKFIGKYDEVFLDVEHTIRLARIKLTPRSNDILTTFEDIEENTITCPNSSCKYKWIEPYSDWDGNVHCPRCGSGHSSIGV